MSNLSPEAWQDIAAMNARTYAMTPEDRAQWFRDHPASSFADSTATPSEVTPVAEVAQQVLDFLLLFYETEHETLSADELKAISTTRNALHRYVD